MNDFDDDAIREHYAAAAQRATRGLNVVEDCGPATESCCGPAAADSADTIGAGRYSADDLAALPAEAVAGSIGCANPVLLAALQPGEHVLDLGSGGGIDVLLSARRVGPTGHVYGVDMTPEMLELARANQDRAGATNVEFLEGRIEALPLPDASVDVVLSNCVISLSADKEAVFAEASRVLRPGGRLAIADIIAADDLDRALRATDAAWGTCIAAAVTRVRYEWQLVGAGFVDVEITASHDVAPGLTSVLVRAVKPA